MILDLTLPVSLLRLRCGDTRDIPILTDAVYEAALAEKKGNLKAAAILCSQYILATLAFDTHQKMGIVEVWGSEAFKNYQSYLLMIVKDPGISSICPIPYVDSSGTNKIVEFTLNWDSCNEYSECDDALRF